ncbi:hypothetical protein JCM19233_4407 [Vibrio astriarenae]|nr:hypothetical protein JCM19233_4407 [Vibrio sp. C7]
MLSRLPNTTKGVSCALISTALFVIVGIFVRQLSETIDFVSGTFVPPGGIYHPTFALD